MKRTNLVLDEVKLKTAARLLGAKTYSAAVNQALDEVIQLVHVRGLAQWFGSGLWEGNLAEMREDERAQRPAKKPRTRRNARSR
jgi:Arc/MetJ family transcription regulator